MYYTQKCHSVKILVDKIRIRILSEYCRERETKRQRDYVRRKDEVEKKQRKKNRHKHKRGTYITERFYAIACIECIPKSLADYISYGLVCTEYATVAGAILRAL